MSRKTRVTFSSQNYGSNLHIFQWMMLWYTKGFPGGTSSKEPACQCRRCKRHGFNPWVGKISWRRAWQTTPVFLPGASHGQRSLVGCSPWGHTVRRDWNDSAQAPTWSKRNATLDGPSQIKVNTRAYSRSLCLEY